MRKHLLCLATLSGVLLMTFDRGNAADKAEVENAKKALLKIAEAYKSGKADDAAKEAAGLTKKFSDYKDIDPFMMSLALKSKGGLGFGDGKAGPDGIEAKFIGLAKKALEAKELDAQAAEITKSTQVMLGLAEMILAKPPAKKVGNKDPKDWLQWSKDMKEASNEVLAAVGKKDTAALKTAAAKLNSSCNNCHNVFK